MTDKQTDEALEALTRIRGRMCAEGGRVEAFHFENEASFNEIEAALEQQQEEIDTLSRMNRALDEKLAEFDGQRVPEWRGAPGILRGCNRVSLIDHTHYGGKYGLVYENQDDRNEVSLSMQDDGKTLKVFITAAPEVNDE